MSDAHETPQAAGGSSTIVIVILSIVVLLATVPTAFLLVRLRFVNPEYSRRNVCQEADLPTAESSPDERMHQESLFRRARVVASKLRGVTSEVGRAIALRSGEVFKKVRGRASRLFDDHSRRYSDLPIMRQKSWQILAESHTELTLTSSKDDEVMHKYDEVEHRAVESPKKSAKTVRFDIGDEVGTEASIQRPQPAVIAESRT